MWTRLLVILCILLFTQCNLNQNKVEKILEDEVEVVLNHLAPYKIGSKSNLILEESLKINTEEDEIIKLGIPDIFGFSVNSSGEIYILRTIKGEGNFIFKFNGNGIYIESFGSYGQGPGELQNPHFIAIDSNDNIMISDLSQSIIRKYDKNGVFLNDFKMESGNIIATPGPRENLLVKSSSFSRDKQTAIYSFDLKLMNYDFELLQLIDKYSYEVRPDKLRATEPMFCWSVSQDNIYVANEDRGYEVNVYDNNGELIKKIRKEYPKVSVSNSYKKEALKAFPEEIREEVRKVLYFPEFHPPIQNMFVSAEGMLFVATFEKGNHPNEFIFDIFNEEGAFIGRKSLNAFIWEGFMWAQIKANKLYCLEEKENGYKQLVVYNMKWSK